MLNESKLPNSFFQTTEQSEFRKSNHRFFPIQETNVDLVTRWRAEEAARWSGEERQRRGKESRFPYLSTDRRDIVDLAIEAKSDFPSPALESSRRRFSSFAHGSLPTPLPFASCVRAILRNDLRFDQGGLLSLDRNKRVNYSRELRRCGELTLSRVKQN